MDHRHLVFVVTSALVVAACADSGDRSWSVYTEPPFSEPPMPPESFPPPQKGPQPDFGSTVKQAEAPPPISGGTLIVTKDGKQAIAADPDRDQVYVVTLADKTVLTVPLQKHDEPGRVVEDAAGRAHVVLRGGGSIATIDIATGTVLARRAVCAVPRGIAFDTADAAGLGPDGHLLVACEGGEVVALGTEPDALPTAFALLDHGLRDVVVSGSRIFVSRFREAEIIELRTAGVLVSHTQLTATAPGAKSVLAWRMIAAPPGPNGDPIVVHEAATTSPVQPSPGGYGGGTFPGDSRQDCSNGSGSIVTSLVSRGRNQMVLPKHAVLPLDIASNGTSFAVVAAGNGHTKALPQVFVATESATLPNGNGCGTSFPVKGQATSIAFHTDDVGNEYIVQSREPAQLELLPSGTVIPLAATSREDTGHAIFHANSGSGLACASCHGEGGDDGHIWNFAGTGPRRTPSLRGTLAGTAPFHWGGEMTNLSMLVDDVMTGRMNGPSLDDERKGALQGWLFALPGPIANPADPASVDRGRTLFESTAVGCSSCHAGPRYTTSATVDVGTGGMFQVPSLVGVAARAPYLHDGCAATLHDRFGGCGGSKHGTTKQLSGAQIDDLVTFLGTL